MHTILRILPGALLMAMLTLTAQQASAEVAEDAAYDERDNFVIDERGACVRTKWMQGDDPCNPTPPPPPPPVVQAPPPAPAPVISREERTVHFDFDSDKLDAEAMQKLDHIATVINQSRSILDVHVLGYTDQFSSDKYNLDLSNRRVAAVMDYLTPRARLQPKKAPDIRGLGKAPAEAECAAIGGKAQRKECMRKERRVEVTFQYER